MADPHNIFDPSYWTQEGYQQRKSGQRKAASELAQKQNQTTSDQWRGIGDFISGGALPKFLDGFKTPYQQRQERNSAAKKAVNKPAVRPSPSVLGSRSNGESSGPIDLNANNPIARVIRGEPRPPSPSSGTPLQSQSSLFDELMGKVTSDWSGPDKSKIDYSPLDTALNARMGALNGLRDKTNQNFEKSDVALEGMHNALQNKMGTESAGRFNSIADTQKQNLQASNQKSQDYLANIKDQDMAKRSAMLKNLGLEESAGAPDSSVNPLNEAIGSIASRNDANVTNAEQDRGTNLAFNQNTINSVGQQGVERRGDLAQQLQQILGRIDMAGADAQAENARARYELEQNSGDKQYQQWRDNKGFLSDTMGMIQDDAFRREELAAKQAQAQSDPREVSGYASIPQDLRNAHYSDQEIQSAMGALAGAVSSDSFRRASVQGEDKVSVLMDEMKRLGITDPSLAFHVATNYANLGSTSKYTDTPY